MIQSNELRIGNYLYETIKINEKTPVKIHSINKDGLVVFEDGLSNDISSLEPIPLTEEILLKCGFESKYRDEEDNKIFNIDSFYIKKHLFYNEFWIDANIITPDRIKYLHQLQNLFWCLTGTEIKINL